LTLDETIAGDASLEKAFGALNESLESAIDRARDRIRADKRGLGNYKSHVSPLRSELSAAAVVSASATAPISPGLSVLDDCGLPFVKKFGPFLNNLHGEVTAKTLPFIGFGNASQFGRVTLAPLWSPKEVLTITIGNKFLNGYYHHVNYLARLNRNDDIWKHSGPQQWFDHFGRALALYMADLFAGKFIDRNGTKVSFDFKRLIKDFTSFDPKQMSPHLAGALVSALVEFLGDVLFQVPFYSGEILKTYREQRDDAAAIATTTGKLKTLTDAVASSNISAADARSVLGYTGKDLRVNFSKISAGGKPSPVVASGLTRLILTRIEQPTLLS
jgi:hypothetical protein